MSKRNTNAEATQLEAPTGQTDDQILHRANFESEAEKIPVDAEASDLERKICELLDQIDEGLLEDNKTNFNTLTIARKYGPAVVELKALTKHGEFMKKLKERYPKTKYPTLNRWKKIAENEIEVASAVEKYPEVAWGLIKMIDYLKGWNPEEEQEMKEEDEEDVTELTVEYNLNEEFLQHNGEASDSSASNVPLKPDVKVCTQTGAIPRRSKLKGVKSAKPEAVDKIGVNNEPKNLKPMAESLISEDADSAVNKLSMLTKQLERLYEQMETLDWDSESKDEWDVATASLKTIGEQIRDKSSKIFNSNSGSPKKATDKSPKRRMKAKPPTEVLSIRKLKSLFGNHALQVLEGYIEELPRNKAGAMRQYKVITPLPTQDEFEELRKRRYTSTASDLVSDAFSVFDELADECSCWYDNLPESLQGSDKACTLEDSRSTLESLSPPELDETTECVQVYYLPIPDCESRAAKRDDAVGKLQAVIDALEEAKNAGKDFDVNEFDTLIDELENAISEADGVEFPSMYS